MYASFHCKEKLRNYYIHICVFFTVFLIKRLNSFAKKIQFSYSVVEILKRKEKDKIKLYPKFNLFP